MNEAELRDYIRATYPYEDESCEWKEFKNLKNNLQGSAKKDVVSYVSAIANMNGGHLILGVKDKTLKIVGIEDFYNYDKNNLPHELLAQCTNLASEGLKVEELTASDSQKTIWIIHIPKHKPRQPVLAHKKAWQRVGESLVEMRQERYDSILSEPMQGVDWSSVILEGVGHDVLDEQAIATARKKYKERNKHKSWAKEINKWDNATFLDKAKVTISGKITRTAVLLLGKAESIHLLSPALPQITWKLEGEERAYEHFDPPFILTTTDLWGRIRNPLQKLFPQDQLLAVEIPKYEARTVLEGMHNCLAHQDYEKCERIIVSELPDKLIFENAGGFIERNPDDFFKGNITPGRYRNAWLAEAMFQVGMVDKMGYGIYEMTMSQKNRSLPLPSYDGSTSIRTMLEVLGRPIDLKYTQWLLERQDLDLDTVILLDRVQKGLEITKAGASRLRKQGLITGHKNLKIADPVSKPENFVLPEKHVGKIDNATLKEVILKYIERNENVRRPEIDGLLIPLISETLTVKQRQAKVRNLLSEMKSKDGTITNSGRGPGALWTRVNDA